MIKGCLLLLVIVAHAVTAAESAKELKKPIVTITLVVSEEQKKAIYQEMHAQHKQEKIAQRRQAELEHHQKAAGGASTIPAYVAKSVMQTTIAATLCASSYYSLKTAGIIVEHLPRNPLIARFIGSSIVAVGIWSNVEGARGAGEKALENLAEARAEAVKEYHNTLFF